MVLDRETLRKIIPICGRDYNRNQISDFRKIRARMEYLDSEEYRDEVIAMVSLQSPLTGGGSTSGDVRDLTSVDEAVEKVIREQKELLQEAAIHCFNRQRVYNIVYHAFISLYEPERDFLMLSLINSRSCVVEILEKSGVHMSKNTVRKRESDLLDEILRNVNPQIADISDFDSTPHEV